MKARPKKTEIRKPLSEERLRRMVDKMPGGLDAFCTHWGWLTFARKIERAHKIGPK